MTLGDRFREGDRLRVVSDPITRGYGVTCYGGAKGDEVIWPGEVGIVTRSPYTAHDGSDMAQWAITFDRGRRVTLSVPDGMSYATATEACFLLASEADPWRRAKGNLPGPSPSKRS